LETSLLLVKSIMKYVLCGVSNKVEAWGHAKSVNRKKYHHQDKGQKAWRKNGRI
jgi:hypothetical protein